MILLGIALLGLAIALARVAIREFNEVRSPLLFLSSATGSLLSLIAASYLVAIGVGSSWVVSEGERVGVVQKVSERGLFIKTTEAELALLGEGSGKQVARVWEASLDREEKNDGIREALEAALKSGGNVRVKYREVLCHAPWRMETDYAILSVEAAK